MTSNNQVHIFFLSLTECDNDMFGENCEQKCGHCANSSTCNPVNGSCLTGCDLGFQGPLCNDGRYINEKYDYVFLSFFSEINLRLSVFCPAQKTLFPLDLIIGKKT